MTNKLQFVKDIVIYKILGTDENPFLYGIIFIESWLCV